MERMTEHEHRLDNSVRETIKTVALLIEVLQESKGLHGQLLLPDGSINPNRPKNHAELFAKIDEMNSSMAYAKSFFDGPPTEPPYNSGDLPDDLADALESFKLALLRHQASGWLEVTQDQAADACYALIAIIGKRS